MNYKVVEKNDKKYILWDSSERWLCKEQDSLDIIATCMENDIYFIILKGEGLSDDFYNLRTGLAGAVLQKFMNYHVKAALVIEDEEKVKGRFREMVIEANKGNDFKVFKEISEAESWLLNLSS